MLDNVKIIEDDGLIRRAMAAYYRAGYTAHPSNTSDHVELAGRQYVRLSNINGTLAVYQVRGDGRLKEIESYPDELDEL